MKGVQPMVLFLVAILVTGTGRAQDEAPYSSMLRIYEDNDFINIIGDGTDEGYTNGTRLDWWYVKNKRPRFFIDRWMLKAGDSSINTFGWGIMQAMVTPSNISKRIPDRKDYPYSGALFVTHSLQSSNPRKKYNLQTEWMIGVMGPPALARETQTLMHRIINYQPPKGWAYQLPTDILVNLELAAEKQLAHINNAVEWIGGAHVFGGTALNGAAVYTLFRLGKMQPYFNGYITQYTGSKSTRRQQIYFIIRPAAEWMLYNALIEGGMLLSRNGDGDSRNHYYSNAALTTRKRIVGKIDYGVVVASGRLGLSFTQTTMTSLIKGMPAHQIGNISLHIAW